MWSQVFRCLPTRENLPPPPATREKTVEHFVEIVRAIGPARLEKLGVTPLLVGNGVSEYEAELRSSLLEAHPGSEVRDFTNDVGALAEIFRESAINIHPAIYEAYGMTVVEAAAFGTPSLIDAGGNVGVGEFLTEGEIFVSRGTQIGGPCSNTLPPFLPDRQARGCSSDGSHAARPARAPRRAGSGRSACGTKSSGMDAQRSRQGAAGVVNVFGFGLRSGRAQACTCDRGQVRANALRTSSASIVLRLGIRSVPPHPFIRCPNTRPHQSPVPASLDWVGADHRLRAPRNTSRRLSGLCRLSTGRVHRSSWPCRLPTG